jgi:hypothetical protein
VNVQSKKLLLDVIGTGRSIVERELAERCNEGVLTAEEEEEYEAYVQASTLVGTLHAMARRILAESQPG